MIPIGPIIWVAARALRSNNGANVQGTGQPVVFLDELRAGLRAAGYRSRIQRVSYRFQKNADRMLVIEAR